MSHKDNCEYWILTLLQFHPNALKEELIRHVEEDEKMSGFDFGIQLLDADRMTYWGKRQPANFWIENASVEWHGAEAVFHPDARLILLPKSHILQEAGEALHRCHR